VAIKDLGFFERGRGMETSCESAYLIHFRMTTIESSRWPKARVIADAPSA